jgi:hypothetical protein
VRQFIGDPRETEFDALALELFHFQYAHNAAYRDFCDRLGKGPDEVNSWAEIPAIITSAFKHLELTALLPDQRTTVFHSSGTTEQRPSRHFHSSETLQVYEEALWRWFKPHVLPERDHAAFLVLAPPASEAAHSSLAHMLTVLAHRFGTDDSCFAGLVDAGGWNVDFSRVQSARETAVICGTAFSFVHWCDYLAGRDLKIRFAPGSRVFETGGYKGRSRVVEKRELHAMIEERLGIPQSHIISEYGMSELSSQAYDRTAGKTGLRLFQFPPWARAQIISPDTLSEVAEGETGLVRILDLANIGSVIAVQTEDLAVRRGAGFEVLGRAALAEPRGCSLMERRS